MKNKNVFNSELAMFFHNEIKDDKTTIIYGDNGSGKTELLKTFAEKYNYSFYEEKHTNGTERLDDIFDFCKKNDNVIIDNIELYLHIKIQMFLLPKLHSNNSNLKIIASTHSPSIINGRWDWAMDIKYLKTNFRL